MKKSVKFFFAVFMISLMVMPFASSISVISILPCFCGSGTSCSSDGCTCGARGYGSCPSDCSAHGVSCSSRNCWGSLCYSCSWSSSNPTQYFRYADGDGYGTSATTQLTCNSAPSGYVGNNYDCNDGNSNIRPGASESCNGVDDDCDGQVDEGVKTTYYRDADGDSYGTSATTQQACSVPSGYASRSGDCNDNSAAINPGKSEACNNLDDNCDGTVDSFTSSSECLQQGICTGAVKTCTAGSWSACSKLPQTELCDSKDNDCDGVIDGFTNSSECSQFGVCAGSTQTCTAGSWSACSILSQVEDCDDIDNDCDGVIDNNREADNCSRTCTVVLGKVWLGTKCCGDEANEGNPYGTNETECGDGRDNDCDGFFDMEDNDCDPTLPEIKSLSHSPENPITQQETSVSTTAADENLDSVKLYVGQDMVKECVTEDACTWSESDGYSVGNYLYNSWAADKAGNYIVSEIKSFAVRGDAQKTCSDNTFGEGAICKENEYCGPPGVFVNSKDGGNVEMGAEGYNELTAQAGIASCCTSGKCTSEYVMPKCESYPVNGVQYDPEIASCNGVDVAAEVESAELKCCSGAVVVNFKEAEFNVYWSRQNSGYFKLREAAEGDNLYCIASAKEGNENVLFEVRKGDLTESNSTQLVNGYATVQKTAYETGTYVCTATMAAQTKSSEIKVTEAGIDPTKLPFFGAIQFVAASLLIIFYYWRKK